VLLVVSQFVLCLVFYFYFYFILHYYFCFANIILEGKTENTFVFHIRFYIHLQHLLSSYTLSLTTRAPNILFVSIISLFLGPRKVSTPINQAFSKPYQA